MDLGGSCKASVSPPSSMTTNAFRRRVVSLLSLDPVASHGRCIDALPQVAIPCGATRNGKLCVATRLSCLCAEDAAVRPVMAQLSSEVLTSELGSLACPACRPFLHSQALDRSWKVADGRGYFLRVELTRAALVAF